jgi:hypothetical protein
VKKFISDSVLEEFYRSLLSGDSSRAERVHIPRSDVFYIRRAYYEHSGVWESLDKIERCMYLEGLLNARDVFEPERKRDWE